MGSLMAGWDSPVSDPKSAKYLRNRSFTKEEIEAYWKLHKKTEEEEEEHLSTLSNLQETTDQESEQKDSEKITRKNAWWTRSNSAFLNEPPVIVTEGPTYKYASQYHITDFSSSEPDTRPPEIIT